VHPTSPLARGEPMRVEHECERQGAWAYLAGWDVRRAKVHGRCEPKSGIAPFERLAEQVMSQEPYRSSRRVFWIVDNARAAIYAACSPSSMVASKSTARPPEQRRKYAIELMGQSAKEALQPAGP